MFNNLELKNYVIDPIGNVDIVAIEQKIERAISVELREVISRFGFLQNMIGGDLAGNVAEFIDMQTYIPQEYVAFMSDGAGNYYVITPDNHVFFWDHETLELTETDSFESFINGFIRQPEPLSEVSWHTQLSFETKTVEDEEKLIRLL